MYPKDAFALFLTQKRFDLIFKWLYLKNPGNDFVKNAYLENIRAFNGFHEEEPSDGVEKTGAHSFLLRFDSLYKSIQEKGFDPQWGPIPIGDNGEISDGAHRLACCAALGLPVQLEPDGRADLYDYKFFRKQHMNEDIMDYGALEYVKLNPQAYIVNLHSVTDPHQDGQVEAILSKYGFVFYKKEINMSFNGYVNLKKLSYGSFWDRESWIGNEKNKFEGAQNHARASMGSFPLRVFVFVCDDLQKVVRAKAEIRNLFNIGNYSVHVNDSREEALWLAKTYFNRNSLHMINTRPLGFEDAAFDRMIIQLQKQMKQNHICEEEVCGAGSTPLNIYGARKSDDLDFLYCGDRPFDLQTDTLSNHDSQLSFYPYSKKEIIQNPAHHLYYHGLKFISLDVLYKMKQKRNEKPKDVRDCQVIAKLKKGHYLRPRFCLFQKQKIGLQRHITLLGFIKFSYTVRKKK